MWELLQKMLPTIKLMVFFALLAVIAANPEVEALAKRAFKGMWASGSAGKEAAWNLAAKALNKTGVPFKSSCE